MPSCAGSRDTWVGRSRRETFFASTRAALEVIELHLRLRLHKRELDEGELLALRAGREAWRERFEPNRSFREAPFPSVRAPHEGAFCLSRLAALAPA